MAANFSLSSLNKAQREAVQTLEGPVLILAGAGTGKTRTVTCRIAQMVEQGVRPDRILAVTFTNKAASEMRERVNDMVSYGGEEETLVCTFHSLCVRILRSGIDKLGYKHNFAIFTASDQKGLIKQQIIRKGGVNEKIEPAHVLNLISKAKNEGRNPAEQEDDLIAAIAQAYQNELRAQNAVDFDDLLVLAEKLLREHAPVRMEWQNRFQYVTVDEFQDTNSLQMQLLQQLVGPKKNVCVVGDDDQSIYGWRGAEVANILEFERFFPNPKVIRLEENYRSTEAILHSANSLIRNNVGRREKQLRATIAGGEPVRLVGMPGEEEEAEFISEEIFGAQKAECVWEDFAVLFRTNGQSRMLERSLRELKIPYRMVGAQSFYDRREVKDILAYLQVLANPDADVSLLRIINAPPRGISQATAILATDWSREHGISVWEALGRTDFRDQLSTRAANAISQFSEIMRSYQGRIMAKVEPLHEVVHELLAEFEYTEWVERNCKTQNEQDQRKEAISEVIQSLKRFHNQGKGLQKFLDSTALAQDREDDDIEKKSGVTLITLHASKGLEYPLVYLVGMEEGILPHSRSIVEGTRDEERRLLYVGITRAQKKLTMTYCVQRKKWGEMVRGEISSFIKEIDTDYLIHEAYEDIMGVEASADETSDFFGNLKEMLED